MFVYVRNLTKNSTHSDACLTPISTVERKDPVCQAVCFDKMLSFWLAIAAVMIHEV